MEANRPPTGIPAAASRAAVLVLTVLAGTAGAGGPAEHRVAIFSPDGNDVRLAMTFDAIAFWNGVAERLGLDLRLVGEIIIASPVTRRLETYARTISQRAGRLRSGPGEPDAPAEVVAVEADVVLLLSRQDLMSFAWPIPKRHGYFIAIEADELAMAQNLNIARNIIAHEIGHSLGLVHNRDPTSLMCGPCRTSGLGRDDAEYMRLTDGDRQRLIERYASR